MKRGTVHSLAGRVGFLLAVVSTSSSLLAQVDSKEAEAWFNKQWTAAQSVVDLGDYSLHWVEEDWYAPSASELDQMRKSVAGHPQHPDRANLEKYERHIRGLPDKSNRAIWARGTGKWRFCEQPVLSDGQLGEFRDFAANGNESWCFLAGTATIVSMKVAAPSGRDYASMEGTVRQAQSVLLFGGLGALTNLKPSVSIFALSDRGTKWSAGATTAWGNTLKAYGSWDSENQTGTVDRVETTAKGETTPWKVIVAKNWRPIPDTQWQIASEVEVAEHGRRAVRHLDVRATYNDPVGFAEATVVPTAGKYTDPVRGEVDLRDFADYRNGTQTVATSAEDGSRTSSTVALRDSIRGPWYLRYAGWIMGALLVTGSALFLRFKKDNPRKERP